MLADEPQGQHLDLLVGEPQVVVDKGHAVADLKVVPRGGAIDTMPLLGGLHPRCLGTGPYGPLLDQAHRATESLHLRQLMYA